MPLSQAQDSTRYASKLLLFVHLLLKVENMEKNARGEGREEFNEWEGHQGKKNGAEDMNT